MDTPTLALLTLAALCIYVANRTRRDREQRRREQREWRRRMLEEVRRGQGATDEGKWLT